MILEEKQEKILPIHIQRVVECIPKGSNRPITVKEISALTGFSDSAIRSYVTTAIVSHGVPIGAQNTIGNSGYFVIETSEEKEKAIRNLTSRIREIAKRVKALEGIGNPNQEKMNI